MVGSVKLIHEFTLQVSVIEVRTVCLIIPITSMATVCIPTWQSFIRNTSNSSKMPCLFCSYSACLSRYLWFTEHRVTGERKNGKKRGHEAQCRNSRIFCPLNFTWNQLWQILSGINCHFYRFRNSFWNFYRKHITSKCLLVHFTKALTDYLFNQ